MKRVGMLAGSVLFLYAASARADLVDDANTVLDGYRASGAQARRLESVFLVNGASRIATFPLTWTEEFSCVTVVALGVRTTSFSLDVQGHAPPVAASLGEDGPEPADDEVSVPAPGGTQSRAGYAEWTLCKAPRGTPRDEGAARALLAMTHGSVRGAVEVLVARHAQRLPPVEELLVERAEGVLESVDDRGAPLVLAPIAERVERATDSARRDGAEQITTLQARSTREGKGALALQLAEGCHRVGVLADAAAEGEGSVDVDAELRVPDARTPFRFDRSHAPDARLDVCVSEPRRLELRWLGAGGPRPITLFDARWSSPRFPDHWSVDEKSALAGALHKRRAPRPTLAPSAEWTGLSGVTQVPLPTERGACYLAALVLDEADAQASRLTVLNALDIHHDESVDEPRGAAVTFCRTGDAPTRAVVEVRGRLGAWRMAMWRLAGASP